MGSLLTLLLLAEDGLELLDAVGRRQPSLARQAERWKNTKMEKYRNSIQKNKSIKRQPCLAHQAEMEKV